MIKIFPVILCGGFGSRLWPLSTPDVPKVFLPLMNSHLTLLQQTIARAQLLPDVTSVTIVCGQDHYDLAREQLKQTNVAESFFLIEPSSKNTAAAMVAACFWLSQTYGNDALMMVMPADHVIDESAAFTEAVTQGVPFAKAGKIVTFGCAPHFPSTEFGYIIPRESHQASDVKQFTEKPDQTLARDFIAQGALWNSGMFLCAVGPFLEQARQFESSLAEHVEESVHAARKEKTTVFFAPEPWDHMTPQPVDRAIIEKSDRVFVIPVDMGWDDLGSFTALWRYMPHDENGNALRGEIHLERVTNSLIITDRPVSVRDLDQMVVITNQNGTLIQSMVL